MIGLAFLSQIECEKVFIRRTPRQKVADEIMKLVLGDLHRKRE